MTDRVNFFAHLCQFCESFEGNVMLPHVMKRPQQREGGGPGGYGKLIQVWPFFLGALLPLGILENGQAQKKDQQRGQDGHGGGQGHLGPHDDSLDGHFKIGSQKLDTLRTRSKLTFWQHSKPTKNSFRQQDGQGQLPSRVFPLGSDMDHLFDFDCFQN